MSRRAWVLFLLAYSFVAWAWLVPAWAERMPAGAAAVARRLQKIVPRFRVVSPGILRGGQPKDDALELLRASGVRTIVNLRDVEDKVADEQREAEDLGMRFVNIPLSPHKKIPPGAVRQFLAVVTDPRMQPVFVHCKAGKDRTGAMIAILRMDRQGWGVDQAVGEMKSFGFDDGYDRLAESVFEYAARIGRVGPLRAHLGQSDPRN